MQNFPKQLKPLFWEFDIKQLSIKLHSDFIIERILEKGSIQSLKWVFNTFTNDKISCVVKSSSNLSPKTKTFWNFYFNYA